MGKQIRVKKGNEVLEIQDTDLQDAVKDGYLPTERIIVANTKTKETYEIDPQDLPNAFKDGFTYSDVKKKGSLGLLANVGSVAKTGGQTGISEVQSGGATQPNEKQQVLDYLQKSKTPVGVRKMNGYEAKQMLDVWDDIPEVKPKQVASLTATGNVEGLIGNDDKELKKQAVDKVINYDKVTTPLRELKNIYGDLQPNDPALSPQMVDAFVDNNYKDKIYSEAVKWYAESDPRFRDELKATNTDPNDIVTIRNKIPDAKMGRIMSAYLSQPDISAFIQNERPDLYPAFESVSRNLIKDNKNYGANVVANEVSQAIQQSGYNSADPIFNYHGKDAKDFANTIAEDLYRDDPEKLKVWNEQIKDNQEKYLDRPSFFEGFAGSVKGAAKGIANTFTQPFQPVAETVKENWEKESSNVSADPKGLSKVMRDIGSGTGFVASLAAPGGVLKAAGVAPKAASAITAATTFFGDELEQGKLKYPDNPVKAWTSASVKTALFSALSYDLFPADKAAKAFGSIKPQVETAVEKLASGEITKEAFRQEINTLGKKAIDFGKEAFKTNVKASTEMAVITGIGKKMDKLMMDGDKYDQFHSPDEEIETFKHLFVSNSLVSALSGVGAVRQKNKLFEESIYNAASNPLQYQREIENLKIKNPELNDKELLDNVDFLAKTKKQLDGEDISEASKKKYLTEAIKAKVARDKVIESPESTLVRKYEDQARQSDAIKERLLSGEDVAKVEQEQSDNDLLEKIKSREEVAGAEKTADLQYFVDKVGEAPVEAERRFGKDVVDELIQRISTEKLQENYDFLVKIDPESKEADAIAKELDKREQAPKEESVSVGDKASNGGGDVESTTNVLNETQKSNPTVWQKIKDAFNNLVSKTKEYLNKAKGTQYEELAKVLGDHLKNVRTSTIEDLKGVLGEKIGGQLQKLHILVNSGKGDLQIFFHEAMHHITFEKISQYLNNNHENLKPHEIDAIQNLQRIFTESKAKIEAMKVKTSFHYGFTNLHEFISEAFSNPEFQRLLKELPSEGKHPTVFKAFLDAIAKLMGLKDATILNDIFHHTEKLLDKPKSENEGIAELYHQAKADGTNPELIKAVEQSLSKQESGTKQKPESVSVLEEGSVGVGGDVEAKRKETEAKIKRKDLFSDGGVFANELGGSGVNSVPTNHSERNGIEFVQFSNPNTGVVDVIMTGKSDNDFVGYYRIYENGKATNKWSSKFENQSRNKEDFKTMISGVQEMLPQGHEYTEKTSISTDGLRIWNQQLSRGYELQYDSKGNLITNRVAINGDAINNELGIAVNKGDFENVSVTNNADMKKVKEALLPYLQKFGLNGGNIHFENGTVEIDLPVLKNTKAVEQSLKAEDKAPVTKPEGKSDVEKQKQLEDKVEEINNKRQSLRGEDGTVPADKMNEWNQLGKELNEAKVSAQRGNSSGSILIKKFEDGADKATSDPVILSEKEKSEASDIIEQVIQGSKTVEEAVKKIARLGYIFDVANANLLTKYISDRLNPDAPKVGNNKSSFQDWVNGKQTEGAGSSGVGGDVERAAKEYVQPDIEDRSIRNSAIESDVNRGRKEILNPEKDKSWDKNHYQYNLELLGSLIAERDSFENIKKENADRDFTEMQGIPPKDENGKFIKNGEEYNEYIDRAILPNLNKNIDNFKEYISEAYQKSKKDGTNPELVKAVEQSLKEQPQKTTVDETKPVIEENVEVVEPIPPTQSTTTKGDVNKGEQGAGKEPPKEAGEVKTEPEGDMPERRFTKQMLRSDELSQLSKGEIAKTLNYVEQSNEMSLKEANDIIEKVGVDEAQTLVLNSTELKPVVRVVIGQTLIKKYDDLYQKAETKEDKDYYLDKAVQTASFVTEKLATEAGQSIQAFSLWSRLSPEGQLRAANQDMARQAKEKLVRREKDINTIGDKFKKANEEAATELTKSEAVKKSVQKTDTKRTAKAKNKIEEAKKKRENIIKKYKGDKGKNLYAGVGLTKDGIEFVGDIVATYVQEGAAKLEIVVDRVLQHLKEVSGKSPNDEVKRNVTDIVKEKIDANSNFKITKELSGLEKEINDIVKEHYTVSEEAKKSLIDKFIEKVGLEKEEAAELAKEIETEFDKIATRKKRNILYNEKARFDKINNTLNSDKKKDVKTVQSDLIKYSNLGAFENKDFAAMVANKFGIGELTTDQAAKLLELANRVKKAPEGSPKNNATEDLLAYRSKLRGNNLAETAQAVWYANVLSGYKTHEKNLISTFFNSMAELGAEMAKDPKSIPHLLAGYTKGVLTRGRVEAGHTIRTGRSPIHIKKIETPNTLEINKFKGGAINPANWFKYVSRLMVAEDVLSFQGLKEARAYQLARKEASRQGFNTWSKKGWDKVNEILYHTKDRYNEAFTQVKEEGLLGKDDKMTAEAKRRIYELMEDSRPQKMTEDAYGFAAKGTFNHESEGSLGALTNAVAGAIDAVNIKGFKPGRIIIPFTRIITNVVNNSLDYTPVGFVRAARGARGFKTFENNQFTKGAFRELTRDERQRYIAKAALGITLTAALQAMHMAGVITITGAGPDDPEKKRQLMQQGWQPYSIKINGKWYSYQYTPLVFMTGFLGNMNDAEKYGDADNMIKKIEIATSRIGGQVADMTWINSASTFLGALTEKNPDTQSRQLSNVFASTVKGFVPFSGAITQGSQLEQNIFNKPQKEVNSAWQALIQDIPIARNSLNDKVNALGEPVVRDNDVFTSKETTDPEWKFLLDKGGWVAPVNKNTIVIYDPELKMDRPVTDDEYYEFSKMRGIKIKEKIKELIEKGATIKGEGKKDANDLTSSQINVLLSNISTQATKETKKELFEPKESKRLQIKISK